MSCPHFVTDTFGRCEVCGEKVGYCDEPLCEACRDEPPPETVRFYRVLQALSFPFFLAGAAAVLVAFGMAFLVVIQQAR